MKPLLKIFILLEFIIGYGPILYMLVLSLIMSPLMLLSIVTGELSMAIPLLSIILGVLGCIGIFQVVIKILDPDTKIQSPKTIKLFLLSGTVALLICTIYIQALKSPEVLMFVLPLAVLIHFVYLLRRYLFKVGN